MNWGLVFGLSLFGLVMGFVTVFFIPASAEVFFWLPIFLVCAYMVAKNAPGKYFLHGLMVSLCNCVWITIIHVLLSGKYAANHPGEVEQYTQMNAQIGLNLSLKQAMLMTGPVAGIMSGLVLGLFCFVASRIVKK